MLANAHITPVLAEMSASSSKYQDSKMFYYTHTHNEKTHYTEF